MKNAVYVLTIFLLAFCSSKTNSQAENIENEKTEQASNLTSQTSKELEYLKVRNDLVQYFTKLSENTQDWEEINEQNNDSLLVLEKMLREMMKNSNIDSVVKFGIINLESLMPELGSGMLDGLTLHRDSLKIFITTKGLFFEYFKSYQINSIDKLTSKQISDIFNSLIFGQGTTVFYSEKISSTKEIDAFGGIGIIAQDIGSFPPEYILVLVASEDFIYIVQKSISVPLDKIEKCQAIYDSTNANSQKLFNDYTSSDLTNKAALNKKFDLEEIAWNKYCECYQENFRTDVQFEDIKKQIEKIISDIENKKQL